MISWAFTNPANKKYGLFSANQAEVIVIQDFKWSSELICWKDLLLPLERKNVKLPFPKNEFATDICINTSILVFATSKAKIEYVGKHYTRDDSETEMVDVR